MSDDTAAPRTLADAGIPDDETAPETLMAHAGKSLELERAIVERLGRVVDEPHATALRDLAAAAEARGWKAAVKDARRALYRFGQRGVVPPPVATPPPPPPRWGAAAMEGWLSGLDGRGDRLVWIARPQPAGGLLVMTAILNEPKGLRDVTVAEMPRKALRRMHDDLRARHAVRMTEADGAYCDALLAEGFERARAAGTAEGVGQYPALRARLTSQPPAALDPPLIARVDPAAADASAVAAGATLLDELEFATWTLDRETLAPYLDEIRSARESPLVLSRPQQEERVQAALVRAERELFAGAHASTWRRRLDEMAYVLHASGRRQLARVAAATAAAVGSATTPLPFFTELLRRSVGAFVVEDDAKGARGSRRIGAGAAGRRAAPSARPAASAAGALTPAVTSRA
jgi:hypothetical protein